MRILFSMLAAAALAGCVGDVSNVDPKSGDDGNDNGDNPAGGDLTAAKLLYDTNVYPIVNAKCTGGGCHSEDASGSTLTRFVTKSPTNGWTVAANYVALVGNFVPTAAPILTIIKPGTHKGVTYTQDEEQKITAWLQKEVELRNGQAQQPQQPGVESISQAAERVMAQFAGCMTLQNFNAANMTNAWANLDSDEGPCRKCHVTGGHGFVASPLTDDFFRLVQERKMFWLQYFTVKLDEGPAKAKVIVNTVSFQGVAQGQAPHREHPRFNPTNNQGMTALNNFYNATMTAIAGGQCQPKPFTM